MKQFGKDHLTALWSVTGIGRQSYQRCLLAQDFWSNQEQVWQKSLLSKKQVESIKKFRKEHNFTDYYQTLKKQKIRVLLDREKPYPVLLKNLSQPPPVLFYKARQKITVDYWQSLFLAVVGTRRVTGYGRLIIKNLLRDCLLASRARLVSGFMYGVDVEAMKIAHQLTQTIGILGYGFDYCYPRHQRNLMDNMLEEGAMFLSEYPPFIQPSASSFVQRNCIIAGLAQAVMVIEAAKNSGSLITAQCAVDEGRAVLAIPGPITNPYSVACHQLIKEGAYLVASVEDFYTALNLTNQEKQLVTSKQAILSNQEERIVDILKSHGTVLSFDQLAFSSHYDRARLAECLLKLQIKQIIKQEGQNYILKI